MEKVNYNEFWGKIPPEEKILLLNRTQAAGALAGVIFVLGAAGVAVGFQFPWLFWGALLVVPVLFKLVVNTSFKRQKSGLMLLYLGARSAARRFAFKLNSTDLTVNLLFRGELASVSASSVKDDISSSELQEGAEDSTPVWIALFGDAVVILSEGSGGARLRFGHLIGGNLRVRGISTDGTGDYSKNRIVMLESDDTARYPRVFHITSRTPGALVVFEKKLQASLVLAGDALARPRTVKRIPFQNK